MSEPARGQGIVDPYCSLLSRCELARRIESDKEKRMKFLRRKKGGRHIGVSSVHQSVPYIELSGHSHCWSGRHLADIADIDQKYVTVQ